MKERERPYILRVLNDGPYVVSGDVPLFWAANMEQPDGSFVWRGVEPIAKRGDVHQLCRCGKSKDMPFCDGSHQGGHAPAMRAPFDSIEERSIVLEGPGIQVRDDLDLCSWTRFCHTPKGKVWKILKDSDDPEIKAWVLKGCQTCPSGRLTAIDPKTGEPLEEDMPTEILVTQDPQKEVSGPLILRGAIVVENQAGERWDMGPRKALCRCGRAHNVPFCDARHFATGYRDGEDLSALAERLSESATGKEDDDVS